MITLLLIRKIVSLFLVLAAGVVLVRFRVMEAKQSRTLSLLLLYLLMPAVILSSYQVSCTGEVLAKLGLTLIVAVVMNGLQIVITTLLRKPMRLDVIEQMSVIYPNAGNLIIPLVTSVLGAEWVIYTSAYIAVQQLLIWSHGRMLLEGRKRFEIGHIVKNVNIISIFIGIVMFAFGIKFPLPVADAVDTLGSMVAGASMLVTGMLIGGMDFKKLLSYRRMWKAVLLRLVALPLIGILVMKLTGLFTGVEDVEKLFLVVLLAVSAPTAGSVTSMAQIYGCDADYASAINVVTTLLCILTMPAMTALYLL